MSDLNHVHDYDFGGAREYGAHATTKNSDVALGARENAKTPAKTPPNA